MQYKQWLLSATSIISMVAASSGSAIAQDQVATQAQSSETVTVTGSRISQSSGYAAPTPVTAVSADQLLDTHPGTLADGLNDLPQFRGSSVPAAGGVSANGDAGANILNLRNLGEQRNLVLLDGQRFVPGTSSGAVDIDQIPQGLVSRVDVVTGGASAAYGSDAVAGVVNFILDKHFTGLKGQVQGGLSTYGDAASKKATLVFGDSFSGGHGHFEMDAEYFDSQGLGPNESNRKWNQTSFGIVPNATGLPKNSILTQGVDVSAATFGGLVTSGPLKGTQFGPGGQPEAFAYGTDVTSSYMIGGDGIRFPANISGGLNRYQVFSRADYDITNDLNVYGEVTFGQAETGWDQYSNYSLSTYTGTIYNTNAYLPAQTLAAMNAAGVTSIPLARIDSENSIRAVNDKQVLQGTAGFNGQFNDDWSYSGYLTFGQNQMRIGNQNVLQYHNYYAALDSVRTPSGQIVCRSTLSGADPGCVPFNPFGAGSPSQAALNYVEGNEYRYLMLKQTVVSVSGQGNNIFSLWSDPASVAFGGEYREETSRQTTTPITQTTIDCTQIRGCPAGLQGQLGPFIVGNPQPLSGSFDTIEGFTEFSVPILKNLPFAEELSIDGAARVTDYSTSGVVETWKVSLSYQPTDDFRLRGTRSRDIRAPNVAELFTGASQGIGTAIFNGQTVDVTTKSSGNTHLQPETADTWTAGVVLTPTWLDEFKASVDYYHINVSDAIATLTRQQTFDECGAGNQSVCANITQTAPGQYIALLPEMNLNSMKVEGFDIEASYDTTLFGDPLKLHTFINDQDRYETQTPGYVAINYAGEEGISNNPKWEGTLSADYTHGPFGTTLSERWIGDGVYDKIFTQGVDINNNKVPNMFYSDASFRYSFGSDQHQQAYFSINNVFNQAPPLLPPAGETQQRYSNFTLYDPIGRYFTIGLRFNY
jgi:iron complex outermembrane recepter protein